MCIPLTSSVHVGCTRWVEGRLAFKYLTVSQACVSGSWECVGV